MTLVFILEFGRSIGGGDFSIFELAQNLAVLGNNITVFVETGLKLPPSNDSMNLKIFRRTKIPRIIKRAGLGYLDRFFGNIYDNIVITRYFKKNSNIDFVIGYQRNTAIRASKFSRKFNLKSALCIFETPTWLGKQLGELWIKDYRLMHKSWVDFKKAILNANFLFTISEITAQETNEWAGRAVDAVIPLGYAKPQISSNHNKLDQIIYIGRLVKAKNVDEIIRAIAKTKSSIKLIVCGDGDEKNNLICLAESLNVNCEFLGDIVGDEKWKLISESKFMVFPSSFEGFGIPPMEALACGIPCICSDIPILKEVYKDYVEYFKEHNIDDMSDRISYLLENPLHCNERGKIGKEYVEDNFGWDKSAQKLEMKLKDYLKLNSKNSD